MKNLRIIRKQNSISMKQLGEYIGVSESTISLYENGKRQADNDTLLKLADFFNVSTDYLLGRTESPMPAQEPSEDDVLRAEVLDLMADLSDQDFQRVLDFVAGLKAARAKE